MQDSLYLKNYNTNYFTINPQELAPDTVIVNVKNTNYTFLPDYTYEIWAFLFLFLVFIITKYIKKVPIAPINIATQSTPVYEHVTQQANPSIQSSYLPQMPVIMDTVKRTLDPNILKGVTDINIKNEKLTNQK